MRILFPTHAFTDSPRSGLHTVIWNTAKELAAHGHEIHVLSTYTELRHETDQSLRKKSIHLHRLAQFPTHNLGNATALRCFLAALPLRLTHRFDWIYVIDTSRTPFQSFKLGAKLASRLLAPEDPETQTIFSDNDWKYDRSRKDSEEGWGERKKPIWFRLFSLLGDLWFCIWKVPTHYANADLVFCQGTGTYDYWKGKIPTRLVSLPNGVQTDILDQESAPPKQTNRFVFLFVGRIAKRKGLFHLLNAFGMLRKDGIDAELWIVGKGSQELSEELHTHLLQDPEHIFSFGEIDRAKIGGFFHACSALVDPMVYQGFSSVCLEALYCGKPVIASRFGGTKDVVTDGEEGYLVDPRDDHALSQAMKKLYTDPRKCQEMGTRGAQKIRSQFLWSHVARTIEQSFSSR